MRIAIQEDMLPGKTTPEHFEAAKALGLQGIEVWARGLTPRVPEIVEAMHKTGVAVSAVNLGAEKLIEPDRAEREKALAALRRAAVDGVDLHAAGLIVVPHFGEPTMPDLTPYKSVVQLEFEMLHNHLRTLSDYVYAIGIDLYIEPVNHYETHFLNTLADATRVRRKIKDHAHVKILANLFHMSMEERDLVQAIRDHSADLGYIHLADSNRRLPGKGMTDFAAVASVLKEANYEGWAALECGQPGQNAENAHRYGGELPAAIETLHKAGW